MRDNYLKSALDAQGTYHETVGRCLHTLVGDLFKARPALLRVQVELDYTPNPPYSCVYTIRDVMVDLGCGWIILPSGTRDVPHGTSAYAEDVGKLVHYIYTHAPAIISVKGMGLLVWNKATYCTPQVSNYIPVVQTNQSF
jgi:hypothetical protein